jgi:hypothetical protein
MEIFRLVAETTLVNIIGSNKTGIFVSGIRSDELRFQE